MNEPSINTGQTAGAPVTGTGVRTPSIPSIPGTGPVAQPEKVDIGGEAMAREEAIAGPSGNGYNGNPMEPSPKLLGKIADFRNGLPTGSTPEQEQQHVNDAQITGRWAKAFRAQFPDA